MVKRAIAITTLAISSFAMAGGLHVVVVDQNEEPYQLGAIWVHRTRPVDPGFYQRLAVERNGEAAIELAPGDYEARWDTRDNIRPIHVLIDDREVARYGKFVFNPGSPINAQNAEFTVTGDTTRLRFVVPNLDTHRLKGTVTTNDGVPLPNLHFDLYRDGVMNCARCAVTDEAGQFEFVCRKFPIRLVPRDYTGSWVFDPPEIAVAAPTQTTLRVTATAKSTGQSNKRMHLSVTPLAAARVAPAGDAQR